jgi:hypothetical protein
MGPCTRTQMVPVLVQTTTPLPQAPISPVSQEAPPQVAVRTQKPR